MQPRTNVPAAVAVTGMAWATPLGETLDGVWQRLLAGDTGFVEIPQRLKVRNPLSAVIQGLDREMPAAQRVRALALDTIRRALSAAGREAAEPDGCLVVGTSLGSFLDTFPVQPDAYGWADELAGELGFAAPPVVVATTCSSGSDALLVGSELVRAGAARFCVCGGIDVVTHAKQEAHSALGTLSPSLLRAFDRRHDGTLLGEGAAFLVLERDAPAGRPCAWLRGAGSSNDATGMTAPDTTGHAAALALERSLAAAGVEAAQISVLNAHGSGTVLNDETECNAFRLVFRDEPKPLVFATKGNFGHSLGATGALEAIATILALEHRQAPPIAGLEEPVAECPLPLARGTPQPVAGRFGLSMTLGFGGFNTGLVFEVGR